MFYTVIEHDRHLRTRGKCRKHEPQASVFYISRVGIIYAGWNYICTAHSRIKIHFADSGSVAPTPLIIAKETSHIGVQDSVSTSEQRLVTSRIISTSESQDGKSSEVATLKSSNIDVGNSQERTAGIFPRSFLTETVTTPFATSFLESTALSASPLTSPYSKSLLVVKDGISSEDTKISTKRSRTLPAFSKSAESSWNSTESYSKVKATGIITVPFHKSNGSISGTTVYLSTIVSLIHSTHSSNHLSAQTSAVKESSLTGYLATKPCTSKAPVIAYSPMLGTQKLNNRTLTKLSGTISSHLVTDMEKSGNASVTMATDGTQNTASLKSTNSSYELEKSSQVTSGPLQSETLQQSVITPSKFPHLSKSSSALVSASGASGDISSGQKKITTRLSAASLVTSLSRFSLTNPVWYKTEMLHQSLPSNGSKSHVEATSFVLASGLKENLKSSSSFLIPRITLLLTSTSSSSPSSPSSIMLSTFSSSPIPSPSSLVLSSLSLKLHPSSSSSSTLKNTASVHIPASLSMVPSNSSGLLLSSSQPIPSTLSLPVTFSVANDLLLSQKSRVQSMPHISVLSVSRASTLPLRLWPLSVKQSKFKSTIETLSLPLLPSTTVQDPLRIPTTSLSTSSLSSSSSSLTTTNIRTATISPAAAPKPSSPTPSLQSSSLLTASLPSVPFGSASTSVSKRTSLPLLPSSFSSLSSLSSPLSLYPSSTSLLTGTSKLQSSLARFPTHPHLTLNTKTPLLPRTTTLSSSLLTSLGTKSSTRLSAESLGNLSYIGTKVAPSTNLHTLESSHSKPSSASPVVNETFLVKFHANCSAIANEDDFKSSFATTVTLLLQISKSDVIVHDIICGSIDVLFVIKSARGRNLANELWAMIKNKSFVFTYNGTEFAAFELREISRPSVTPTAPFTSSLTPSKNNKHERKKIVFIIFVFIGSVFAALFIFLLVVFLARFSRCCRKTGKLRVRRNGRFHAPFESELKRFAVRTSLFQGMNFYGDITELEEMKQDAEIVEDDIDIEEEFSEIHPVDTNTCLLKGSNHTNSNKVEERKFVFDDDDSCSSILFY